MQIRCKKKTFIYQIRSMLYMQNFKFLSIALFMQAVLASILLGYMISELHRYDAVWNSVIGPLGTMNSGFRFFLNIRFRRITWFNILCGFWFQFFFALDSHFHQNAAQVLVIIAFNLFLLINQIADFAFMTISRDALDSVQSILTERFSDSSVTNTTINMLDISNQYYDFAYAENGSLTFGPNAVSLFLAQEQYLLNAYNINFTLLIIVSLFAILVSYFAFMTSRDYGWSIYEVNGACIKKRDMITRYHIFMLALKLNIYFSICDFAAFFYYVFLLARFDSSKLAAIFAGAAEDFKHFGYAAMILVIVSASWCLISALLFYFAGVHAIRKSNYWLMGLVLVVYLIQIFIQARLALYKLNVAYYNHPYVQKADDVYLASIVLVEIVLDIFIIGMGAWVMYDFKDGLANLVNAMYDNRPWLFTKKPQHLTKSKIRMVID